MLKNTIENVLKKNAEELNTPPDKLTVEDILVRSVIKQGIKKGSVETLFRLAELTGQKNNDQNVKLTLSESLAKFEADKK